MDIYEYIFLKLWATQFKFNIGEIQYLIMQNIEAILKYKIEW